MKARSAAARRLAAAALLGWLCGVAAPAAAGGRALVQTLDPEGAAVQVDLEFQDPQHLRLSSPDHPEGYLLLQGGRSYNVVTLGQFPLVLDTARLVAQMGGQAMPPTPAATDDIRELLALTALGEKEVVAGISGERYRLRYVDGARQTREEIAVLARDPLLRDMSLALYELGKRLAVSAGLAPPAGSERFARELASRELGLLRFGERLRVVRVDRQTPAAERFELPAPPADNLPTLPDLSDFGIE